VQTVEGETYESLIEIFREAFDKERGNKKEDWQNLKLVLGGGGAKLKAYQEAATRAFTFKDSKKPKPPEVTTLPKPNDFQMSGLPPEEFHRFAVAYGLSHERVNLPDIIFAKDVQPLRKPTKHTGKNTDWYEK
jgi:cell division ATPase FtsA